MDRPRRPSRVELPGMVVVWTDLSVGDAGPRGFVSVDPPYGRGELLRSAPQKHTGGLRIKPREGRQRNVVWFRVPSRRSWRGAPQTTSGISDKQDDTKTAGRSS